MTEISDEVLRARYFLPGETHWDDICRRVSGFIGDSDPEREEYFEMMKQTLFIPNSPCLFNAGTKDPLMSACFALGIDDSIESIYSGLGKSALLFKMGAGVGFNFSNIRPVGSKVGSTQGVASGVLSFMRVYNVSTDVVKQAGRRRGAAIAILNDDHPEIEDFIRSKLVEGEFPNFNISVLVSDAFLQAVEGDKPWDLKFDGIVYRTIPARSLFKLMVESTHALGEPGYLFRDAINRTDPDKHLGEIVSTNPCLTGDTQILTSWGYPEIKSIVGIEVDAWNGYEWSPVTPQKTGENQALMRVAFSNGSAIRCTPYHEFVLQTEAGVIYRNEADQLKAGDRIWNFTYPNKDGSVQDAPCIVVTSIEHLSEREDVYCLQEPKNRTFIANGILVGNCGEIPLRVDKKTGGGESCNLGSIDLSKFVDCDMIDYTTLDTVIRKSVRFLNKVIDKNNYPFPEIEKLTKDTRKTGLGWMGIADAFIKLKMPYDSPGAKALALELGYYMNEVSIQESMALADVIGCYPAWEGSEWQKNGIAIANSTLTCNAPTGSISLFADCSPGIEPVFSFVYTRENCVGKEFYIVHPLFEKQLKEVCVNHADNDGVKARELFTHVIEHCHAKGSIQDIAWLPEDFKAVFKTAMDISAKDHVDMQAAFQKHCGNSISKTINLKKDAKIADIADILMYAWKSGCKGITIYRQGSRDVEVMTLSQQDVAIPQPYVRPEWLPGFIGRKKSGCGEIWMVFGYDTFNGVDKIVESFIPSSSGCQASNEGEGRMISKALQHNVPVEVFSKQLHKVKCPTAMLAKADGRSCPDIIGSALQYVNDEYLNKSKNTNNKQRINNNRTNKSICPECGSELMFGEGCNNGSCKSCGWEGCH